ncbi:MAG TPA: MlaD family protein [Candidatus Paceibacterota bacterium]|nr:MlaD family protein [Verrucomicrobiota bacterium]HSA10500.1 MlaD family protein [Candidatus Paceibacterota bacterium]
MALQDLTPQLRTRLSRMERAVGWFVALAMALLVFGFAYYVYHTAERKGWFLTKAPYYTFTDRATGLKVGDPVMLMGLTVGQITRMEPMPPEEFQHNIYVEFEIKDPYYGYLWTVGSRAKVTTADLLGKRVLEVTKGTGGYPTYIFYPLREVTLSEARGLTDASNWLLAQEVWDEANTNLLAKAKTPLGNFAALAAAGCTNLLIMNTAEQRKTMTGVWNDEEGRYDSYTRKSKPYPLLADESAAVTERLEKLVDEIEQALPNILRLTNQLAAVLSNSASLTSNLNTAALGVQPSVSNIAALTARLNQPGALGEWLLPTNISRQLEGTLGTADTTLARVDTNLTAIAENLGRSLDNLANLTSNLNSQVEANTNILGEISRTIVDADTFIQGLKRHWLLRSAFKVKDTNGPSATAPGPLRSPKDTGRR